MRAFTSSGESTERGSKQGSATQTTRGGAGVQQMYRVPEGSSHLSTSMDLFTFTTHHHVDHQECSKASGLVVEAPY